MIHISVVLTMENLMPLFCWRRGAVRAINTRFVNSGVMGF